MIDPFDIISGKVVQNHIGTFWFKEPGNNMQEDGFPIFKNLHREDGYAVVWAGGTMEWRINGRIYGDDGQPAFKGDKHSVPTVSHMEQ